ncbi:MAG TPA: 16S rRNA (uracil(1498)-N(3))-methyltransferase [Kofleriaceae bacterium]|nr:16S rRNA (uracil(1498)-N(3))-methyltransferase [Kofleriaceae bacterium]
MNLLLLEPGELAGDTATLADRRAAHLRAVLGVRIGSRVRAGVLGGGTGTAEVIADDGAALTLRLALAEPARPPLPVELVLAVPRPKVLSRTIEIAAAFGVARIALTNAWRVDKSYLSSPRVAPEALALAARLGAEQGATTHVPEVALHRRLMELLDGRWPAPGAPPRRKLVAHPGGVPIEQALDGALAGGGPGGDPGGDPGAPIALAIGPEGGWIAREVETFAARGFTVVSHGESILRVEAAVAAALGQLVLLRRLGRA